MEGSDGCAMDSKYQDHPKSWWTWLLPGLCVVPTKYEQLVVVGGWTYDNLGFHQNPFNLEDLVPRKKTTRDIPDMPQLLKVARTSDSWRIASQTFGGRCCQFFAQILPQDLSDAWTFKTPCFTLALQWRREILIFKINHPQTLYTNNIFSCLFKTCH